MHRRTHTLFNSVAKRFFMENQREGSHHKDDPKSVIRFREMWELKQRLTVDLILIVFILLSSARTFKGCL